MFSRLTKKSANTYIEIPFAGRSSNGRTADSESAYRGSNPCLPAKLLKHYGQPIGCPFCLCGHLVKVDFEGGLSY